MSPRSGLDLRCPKIGLIHNRGGNRCSRTASRRTRAEAKAVGLASSLLTGVCVGIWRIRLALTLRLPHPDPFLKLPPLT